MTTDIASWIRERAISEVECIVPDMNGIQRGKVLPAAKFLKSVEDRTLRIPGSVFIVTVTGGYPEDIQHIVPDFDPDLILVPDATTIREAPGYKTPTAYVIADAFDGAGKAVEIAPRQILKKVLALYAAKGWKPVIAPEAEFYLVSKNLDADFPLTPPPGRSGRAETASEAFGLEALSEYEDIIEQIYDWCEKAELNIDTMIHEAGAAQLEVNFIHGDPLALADQVLLFKRIVRQVALEHGVYATFMAKPMANEPGSAMHVHQSLVDADGRNIFSNPDGSPSKEFYWYIGGLQKYTPAAMALFAPYVNSYRRLARSTAAPINIQWGTDNRTVGIRSPVATPAARRVENRVIGADANPYVALAATLACGYLGIKNRIEPTPECKGDAYLSEYQLPRSLNEALGWLADEKDLHDVLGKEFITVYSEVKDTEYGEFMKVISPWEREHLLLHV